MKQKRNKEFWFFFNIFFLFITLGIVRNIFISYSELNEKYEKVEAMEANRKSLQRAKLEYEEAINEINKKPKKEEIARNKLYMKKSGERVYRVITD